MKTVGVREVRLSLSKLLRRVKRGEEIIISEYNVPVARLVPYPPQARKPFPSRAAFRAQFEGRDIRLSQAVIEERDESD